MYVAFRSADGLDLVVLLVLVHSSDSAGPWQEEDTLHLSLLNVPSVRSASSQGKICSFSRVPIFLLESPE